MELIAKKRAQAQKDYKKRHYDEDHPWDSHGGRFNYDGPHIEEDKETHDHPAHAAFHSGERKHE